ncbi:MAG: hypothetical protein IPK44_01465 [Candidatus Accumulibacter sp.]|uniref:hypothetical protein n=1 Tax=Accumulibacter sp. TaxID=2053492 RepID=UPI002586E0BF|nr:hypothetical protein [Accumulibacter sp.]MBK8113268.1 hypothetical protein [Accumulibacter sp.]
MRLTQFGTYVFPLFNKRDIVSTGDTGGTLLRLPGGGAYDAYGTDPAPEGIREVSTEFEIIASTTAAVQTARDQIRARAGLWRKLWAHYPDGSDRWAWARMSKVKMERRREYLFYQPVGLTFEIKDPGWNGTGHGATWYLDSGLYLDAGLYLDYDDTILLDGSPKSATITNGGNRTVTAVVLGFRAAGNAISGIRFVCGSCDWTFSGSVAAGKILTIDTGTRSIRNDGVDAYSLLTLNAGHTVADWLQLAAGANTVTITYTCAGAASTLTPTFYDGWA